MLNKISFITRNRRKRGNEGRCLWWRIDSYHHVLA